MNKIIILPSFERSVKRLTISEKRLLRESLEIFNSYIISGNAPYGFRYKKIGHDKYEFRADIKLRVLVKKESSNYYLVLAGNHEDILRYLRSYQ